MDSKAKINELAPNGLLRVGINLSNFLLVTNIDSEGVPDGVAPDFARAIAKHLDVSLSLVTFPSPGELADAADKNIWDIGLIAAEPARAESISFTSAYVEIEATYMVSAGSSFRTVSDVDQPGVRIAVSARSAYDLYLTRTLKHASLVRANGLKAAFELFEAENMDALAGLRPGLLKDAENSKEYKILDGRFTAVQQSVGVVQSKSASRDLLDKFVRASREGGLIQQLIEKHGMAGRLLVAG